MKRPHNFPDLAPTMTQAQIARMFRVKSTTVREWSRHFGVECRPLTPEERSAAAAIGLAKANATPKAPPPFTTAFPDAASRELYYRTLRCLSAPYQ